MITLKAIKEMLSNLAGSTDEFDHVPVFKGADLARIIHIMHARNTSVLKAMLAKQAWLAVLILPGVCTPGIVEAIDKNLAAVCLGSELAEQVHLSVHRTTEYGSIPGVTQLVDTEVNCYATFNRKGNNLMLKFVVPKLGSERFSEVLQNQDNAFIRLLWLGFFAEKLLGLAGHAAEHEDSSFHQSSISERIVML